MLDPESTACHCVLQPVEVVSTTRPSIHACAVCPPGLEADPDSGNCICKPLEVSGSSATEHTNEAEPSLNLDQKAAPVIASDTEPNQTVSAAPMALPSEGKVEKLVATTANHNGGGGGVLPTLALVIAGLVVACIAAVGAYYVNSRSSGKSKTTRHAELAEERSLIAEEAPSPIQAAPLLQVAPVPTPASSTFTQPLAQPKYRVVTTKATQVYTPGSSVKASTASLDTVQVSPAAAPLSLAAQE